MIKSTLTLSILLSLGSPLLLAKNVLSVSESEKAITIKRGGTLVLAYHKAEVPPPKGVDPIFHRSGFIHPLCAPNGGAVTGIHPADHYHHLGLWHAWVKTKHGKDTPDFWNLKGKTGRVRYKETKELIQGKEEVGFRVVQEHVAYKGKERVETVVLEEVFEVTASFEGGANVVNYRLVQKNVTEDALEFPAYRYGGCFAYRAPHHWDKTNSDYLTDKGLDRSNSHQSRAKWVAMHGPTDNGVATLSVLIHPKNHDFPQRLRTWPANSHNGAIFFNVVPAQEKPWGIKAGESIKMEYRLVVSEGKPDKAAIEKAWKGYAAE